MAEKKRVLLLVNSTRQSGRENFSVGRELLKPGGLSRSPCVYPLEASKLTERMNVLCENLMLRGKKFLSLEVESICWIRYPFLPWLPGSSRTDLILLPRLLRLPL